MKIKNQDVYNEWVANNSDPYGKGVIDFAIRWADIMELKIANGEPLNDVASQASHEADTEGITGFMYGCAVGFLATSWEHGEQLRKWHNKDCQLGTEGDEANESGGVLNPALMCIGKK